MSAVADSLTPPAAPPAGAAPADPGAAPPAGAAPPPAPGGDQPPAAPPVQPRAWMNDLPDDLRRNETLARYETAADLAKGYLETREWARGRIALPKADDPASFAEFAGKLRPEKPDDYKVHVPEGDKGEMAGWFKSTAHELGLHPTQAERLSLLWNEKQAADMQAFAQAGRDEIKAIELEMGAPAFTRRTIAVEGMLRAAGIDGEKVSTVVSGLEQVLGAADTMRFLFHVAQATGELEKVDGASVDLQMGTMSPEAARAETQRMLNDPAMQGPLRDQTSAEYKRFKQLEALSARRS